MFSRVIEPESTHENPTHDLSAAQSIEPTMEVTFEPSIEVIPIVTEMPTYNTLEPTAEPTDEPTDEPTTDSTSMYSDLTKFPSVQPTQEPSVEGTTLFTTTPTQSSPPLPTYYPSNIISSLPTWIPSKSTPTPEPTTEASSFSPSVAATQSPSFLPTIVFTSIMPSTMPSSTFVTFIRFRSSFTIENMQAELDSTEKDLFTSTVALVSNLPTSSVRFISISNLLTRSLRVNGDAIKIYSVSSSIVVETTALYVPALFLSPEIFYFNLTSALNSSVISGSFINTLRKSNSIVFSNATVVGVKTSEYEVIQNYLQTPPEQQKQSWLSSSIIIAIVLSVVAAVILALVIFYYYQTCSGEDEFGDEYDKISL